MMECVYHSDRYALEALARDMHKKGFITREHRKVMAMTVCTCRSRASHRRPISEQEIRVAAAYVRGSFSQAGSTISEWSGGLLGCLLPGTREMATKAAQTSLQRAGGDQTTSSHDRLTVIISDAIHRLTVIISDAIHRRLDPAADDVTTAATLLGEEREAAKASMAKKKWQRPKRRCRGKQLTRKQIAGQIIRRKQRKLPIKKTLLLPIPASRYGRLELHELVGPNFSRLSLKHGCVLQAVQIDAGEFWAGLDQRAASWVVTQAWIPSQEVLEDVVKLLGSICRELYPQMMGDESEEEIIVMDYRPADKDHPDVRSRKRRGAGRPGRARRPKRRRLAYRP